MLQPRWKKVLRDLANNKTRTLLVVLSIAIGVFAFGTISATRENVLRELDQSYLAINPASAIVTTELFDDDLIDAVRRIPGIAAADGQRSVDARILIGPDTWYEIELFVLPDDGITTVNMVRPETGAWPPPDHTLLVERSALGKTHAEVGDVVLVEMAGGEQRSLPIAGLTHDLSVAPAPVAGKAFGYISFDTLEWLGGARGYDAVQFVVAEQREDEAHIWRVAAAVENQLERSGREVVNTDVPTPLQHPAEDIIRTILLILGALGVLSLLLSGFLIINTIGAILAQQIRQIGIMKAVGARNDQITALYLGMVLAFGVLALAIAVPTGAVGAFGFSTFLASQLNLNLDTFRLAPTVLLMQTAAALLIPVGTALPVISSTVKVTVREALDNNGPDANASGEMSLLDRLIERIRGLPRPLLLSLRNTFRRKGRLIRTLTALTLGGAVFISVLTVRSSLFQTLDDSIATKRYDVDVRLSRSYRVAAIEQRALQVPGVVSVEGWGLAQAVPVRADGSEGETLSMFAPPADTVFFQPAIPAGRWLLPEDEHAIVVSSNYLLKEPATQLGDEIVLKVDGEEFRWRVVGISEELMPPTNPALVYVSYDVFTRRIGQTEHVRNIKVATERHDAAYQARIAQALNQHFDQTNVQVRLIQTTAEDRVLLNERFTILTIVLSLMALLIGMVGAFGLMGTMSMNVIERTKEIGIMRAVGASDGAIQQIVIVEGVLIGMLAWCMGTVLSLPLSQMMSMRIGNSLFNRSLSYTYASYAVGVWLLLVLLLAALASYVPARNAARLTVREVLSYE